MPENDGWDLAVENYNRAMEAAAHRLPFGNMPISRVRWVHIDQMQANAYNPNSVAGQEMKLLHTSIKEDGYTQPVVAIWDEVAVSVPCTCEPIPLSGHRPSCRIMNEKSGRYVIVDGFHRYMVMRSYPDISEQTRGYLPVVVIDKPPADRMASTVRHNRARGRHSVAGMGSLVFGMLSEGQTDAQICNKLGMEAEELARLKHITGYSKLYADATYSPVVLGKGQLDEKAKYKRAHPEEAVQKW